MEYCKHHINKVYTKKQIDKMKKLCKHSGVYSTPNLKEFRIYCFKDLDSKI